jgi:nicotinamidase-related amidase
MLPEKTIPALITIDVQNAIDDPMWGPRNNPDAETRLRDLIEGWRDAAASIFHVRHDSTDPTSPYRPGQPGNDFKADVAPQPGEPIIAKQTNSAFIGTGLEGRLRRAGHQQLVMAGVLTSNSLEMSVRHAGNLGFEVSVVADASWAVDKTDLAGHTWTAAQVHALSLAHMHGEYARVIDTARALALLR